MDDQSNNLSTDNDFNGPIIKFQEIVNNLRSELDEFSRNHATSDGDNEKSKAEYQTNIIPKLLQLRKLNRISKERIEEKSDRINQFNRMLVNLREQCDNITFEASCLKHEVSCAKKRLSPTKSRDNGDNHMKLELNGSDTAVFDIDEVGLMSHAERLQIIDQEEAKRRGLQERLAEATAETDEISLVCEDSSAQLNRLKPYIKQLLDKVDLGDTTRAEKKD